MNVTHSVHNVALCVCYVYVISCICTLNLALIMHNAYMQALCNHMNLVRIPRRDHMYLVYVYMSNSRRERVQKSRSPKLMMRRSRSYLVEKLIGVCILYKI